MPERDRGGDDYHPPVPPLPHIPADEGHGGTWVDGEPVPEGAPMPPWMHLGVAVMKDLYPGPEGEPPHIGDLPHETQAGVRVQIEDGQVVLVSPYDTVWLSVDGDGRGQTVAEWLERDLIARAVAGKRVVDELTAPSAEYRRMELLRILTPNERLNPTLLTRLDDWLTR